MCGCVGVCGCVAIVNLEHQLDSLANEYKLANSERTQFSDRVRTLTAELVSTKDTLHTERHTYELTVQKLQVSINRLN